VSNARHPGDEPSPVLDATARAHHAFLQGTLPRAERVTWDRATPAERAQVRALVRNVLAAHEIATAQARLAELRQAATAARMATSQARVI
jgi:hypothetical protein